MPKFEEIAHKGRCDVCGKQTDVAVCASSCGPISLAYCRSCLEAGLEPYGIMLAYISGAGHWPDDINPAYQELVRKTWRSTAKPRRNLPPVWSVRLRQSRNCSDKTTKNCMRRSDHGQKEHDRVH